MKIPELTVRPCLPADCERLAELLVVQNKIYGRRESVQGVTERLKRPGFDPEKDLFVTESDGSIVGYAWSTIEETISRIHLHGWISPDYRRKGAGRKLLNLVSGRAKERGLASIHTGVYQENRLARDILPKLGFSYLKRYIEMELEVRTLSPDKLDMAVRTCRQLDGSEEASLAELQNRAFHNHWGYNLYTYDTFHFDINLNNRSYRDIVVSTEGSRITGYCWTEVSEYYGPTGTTKRGTINMLGVDPELQNRGIGRTVLTAGLAYLKGRGVNHVSLSVDAVNRNAWRLYRSSGFTECGSILWYGKTVRQETGTR